MSWAFNRLNTRSVTRAIVMQGVPSLLLACGASSFGDCEGLFGPSKAEKEAAELKKKLAEQEAELAKHKEELAKHVDYIAGIQVDTSRLAQFSWVPRRDQKIRNLGVRCRWVDVSRMV